MYDTVRLANTDFWQIRTLDWSLGSGFEGIIHMLFMEMLKIYGMEVYGISSLLYWNLACWSCMALMNMLLHASSLATVYPREIIESIQA